MIESALVNLQVKPTTPYSSPTGPARQRRVVSVHVPPRTPWGFMSLGTPAVAPDASGGLARSQRGAARARHEHAGDNAAGGKVPGTCRPGRAASINNGVNRCAPRNAVTWSIVMPRSASSRHVPVRQCVACTPLRPSDHQPDTSVDLAEISSVSRGTNDFIALN